MPFCCPFGCRIGLWVAAAWLTGLLVCGALFVHQHCARLGSLSLLLRDSLAFVAINRLALAFSRCFCCACRVLLAPFWDGIAAGFSSCDQSCKWSLTWLIGFGWLFILNPAVSAPIALNRFRCGLLLHPAEAFELLDRGGTQIRTGGKGFAILCLTTWPCRRSGADSLLKILSVARCRAACWC